MFVFTQKAKIFAAALTLIGLIMVVIGFNSAGHEAEGHDAHAIEMHADHADAAPADEVHAEEAHADHAEVAHIDHAEAAHGEEAHADHSEAAHADHTEVAHADHAEAGHGDAHGGHEDHGAANRPWAALLVNTIFFLGIGIGTLFFLAIQYAAQAGWSAGILRVMESVALFVGIPLLGMLFLVITGTMEMHHVWHWMQDGIMDPANPNYDKIIAGKEGYLNDTFFTLRTVAYLVIWAGAAYLLRRNSLKEDQLPEGQNLFFTQRKLAATFIVLYAVTSSTSAWDWIMSIDTHWFSTLFGWYTFAGMFVTALTVLNVLVMFLRVKNYLPWVNDNHQHDLGKFMFAFSVFWTYLWFSQYMLIWYSDIPEETPYYLARFGEYKTLFITMLAFNFIMPVLVLMSRDSKRIMGFILLAAVFVLAGHWMDHYIMIMPGSVGYNYGFGWVELGGFLFYAGLLLYVVQRNLAAAPLKMKNHAMIHESKLFHQ